MAVKVTFDRRMVDAVEVEVSTTEAIPLQALPS